MTNVTYCGHFQAVELPDGTVFTQGESVAVDDELAKSLTGRNDFVVTDENKNEKGDE